MSVAVIATGGKQYAVHEGDAVTVEKLPGAVGDTLTFDDLLSGRKVTGEITGHGRAEKKIVFRYKSKTRHRVKRGHRQAYSVLKITGIQ